MEHHRDEILQDFPRDNFKKKFIMPTFFEGFKDKMETTFENIKANVDF